MDKISPQDDDVQSLLSDVTGSVENDTDTLGRQILQHQRDAQRINDLMQSHGQAFRKAKPINPRLALTLDNLERNDHVDDARYSTQGPREHRPPSIGSSNDSDPPLNVPREWGRKGKQNNGWMRRIHQDENAALRHTVSIAGHESSQVDWAAAADQPSGSVEQRTPPSQRRQQPSFTPPNNSLDRIRQWEADQDLTSASLLASTPALPSRNRSAIEEIRQREIHVIQQRGVASIRRQMYEQSTTETTRRRRSGDAPSEPTDGQAPTSAPAPKRLLRRSSVLSNKENIPTNSSGEGRNLPQVLHKSVESIGVIDQGNQATAQRDTTVQRPQQKRNDSMTLLRRLARVSSTSPSPTPTPAKENVDSEKEPLDGDVQADELRLAQGTPPLPERITDKYDGTDSQPRVLNQPNTSANTDSTPRPVGRLTTAPQAGEETQAQQINNTRLPHETPVVTGAWIDTPRANAGATTTDDIRAALKDLSADTLIPRPRSAPTLPSSALDAVLQDFRERSNETDEENALGDSTIASLEDILHPSSNDPTIVLDIPDAALLDASLADAWVDAHTDPIDTIPTTQAECDRRQELLAIESMNNHLRTARTTLKDTSRALRKVEHRVDAANNASPSKLRPATLHNETATAAAAEDDDTLPAQNVVQQHTHAHTPGICASCGRSTSVFKTLLCEYLSLFYRRDASSRAWGIRLTSLGMACAVFWIWFASESTAWYVSIFSHFLFNLALQPVCHLPCSSTACSVFPTTKRYAHISWDSMYKQSGK